MSPLEKILDKAFTTLALDEKYVFWASMILRLKHKEVPAGHPCDSAYTDSLTVYYNQKFMEMLKPAEHPFVVAHEVGHIVHEHCTTFPADLDEDLWNQAGDYVINLELKKSGMPMPTTIKVLVDSRFDGMTTMQVYRILQQEEAKKPGTHKGKNPMPDFNRQPLTQEEQESQKQQIDSILLGANMAAEMAEANQTGKQFGRGTKDMARRIEDLLNPPIPWQHYLKIFCEKVTRKPGRTWSRLRRRMLVHDITAPERRGKSLGRISWAIDVSGSIGKKEFTIFLGGVYQVLKLFKPDEIKLYQFDTDIKDISRICTVRDLLNVKFSGGGGTCIDSTIEDFARDKASLGMFILTDGYLSQHNLEDPKRPVIWFVYDNPNFVPKFGKVVHFTLDGLV